MKTMANFPYWDVEFDKDGRPVDASAMNAFVVEVKAQSLTDLFIFSHGWNNDWRRAHELYEQFFNEMRGVIDQRRVASGSTPGVAGVIWPSILFPDDEPAAVAGGAAGFEERPATDLASDLKKVFSEQPGAVDELMRLLEERPDDLKAFERFQELLNALAPAHQDFEESGESALLKSRPERAFEVMAALAPADREAAAGLPDGVAKLWQGAKEALRATTYWSMKQRAGVVGERGLGPLVGRLHETARGLRVHLVGHSFGCRVVSFALKGLPAGLDRTASPVKTLFLLQGAFSHFAFSDSLPHSPERSGALKGMATRVDGPLTVSFSQHDLAVCKRYPQASFVSRDDAANVEDAASRWGAMGSRGAQAVNATVEPFKTVGEHYGFAKGKFLNLDGDQLITRGGPPSGAHSDIIYPEIAWAVLEASGLAR